jgi:hypothetical protein
MRVIGMHRAWQRGVLLAIGCVALIGIGRPALGDVASDHPAAILVFPKLLVDTANGLDTIVRISNVSETPLKVFCFYVDTTPQCSITGGNCFPDERTCSAMVGGQTFVGECFPIWQPTDFVFRLTQNQPTGWLVSQGESVNCGMLLGVCSNNEAMSCRINAECGAGNRCILPPCLPLDGLLRPSPTGQTNEGAIPLSPEDPFIGELKCIAVDETEAPIARNDLIGEAIIGRSDTGPKGEIDVAGYNAIGIPAIPGTGNRDDTLVIGGSAETAEYEGCPNVLILDHYADGAVDPAVTNLCEDGACTVSGDPCAVSADCEENRCIDNVCTVTHSACNVEADCDNTCVITNTCMAGNCTVTGGTCTDQEDCPNDFCSLSGERCVRDDDCTAPDFQTRVVTNLTLVPCTEDFENRDLSLSRTVAQFLVFSEFEQRFSTSITVECFKEIRLSNIGFADNTRSVFSAGVLGTLTGQTRIRGVVSPLNEAEGKGGNALLGVAEEFRCAGPAFDFPLCNFVDQPEDVVSSTAKNLHFQGRRPQPDFVYLP